MFGKDGEFHSKINGRPFVFAVSVIPDDVDILTNMDIGSIRSNVAFSKLSLTEYCANLDNPPISTE